MSRSPSSQTAVAPPHTPALVHIAPRPWQVAYCGTPRNYKPQSESEPTCVVCLAMYEARRGHPWRAA